MYAAKADECIVVTTGRVSDKARSWAEGKPIRIIELDELTALIREHLDESTIIPEHFVVPRSVRQKKLCRRCGRPLRRVKWRGETFMGCSGYPECRSERSTVAQTKDDKAAADSDPSVNKSISELP